MALSGDVISEVLDREGGYIGLHGEEYDWHRYELFGINICCTGVPLSYQRFSANVGHHQSNRQYAVVY